MASNSALRLFLIISIIIIMAGILLIVINQFDRGYVFIGEDTEFQAEQKKLIDHVYLSREQQQETPLAPVKTALQQSAPVVVPPPPLPLAEKPQEAMVKENPPAAVPAPVAPQPKISSAQDIFAENPWEPKYQPANDYHSQLLRNNPWSPYYKPGY